MILLACAAAHLLASPPPPTIAGDYLEARLANGETVVAWEFRDGGLAGVKIAAVLTPGRTVLHLDALATPEQRRRVLDLFGRRFHDIFGFVAAIQTGRIELEHTAGGARLKIPGVVPVELRRSRLPGRLPYEPLLPLSGLSPAVGPGVTGYLGPFLLRETSANLSAVSRR